MLAVPEITQLIRRSAGLPGGAAVRDLGSILARVRRKKFRLPDSRSPGSIPRRERVRFLMSLVGRLRSERPGFESGFGPTAMSEMARCQVGTAEM